MKPRIQVTQSALLAMVDESLRWAHTETSWGVYGFIGDETVLVSGILSPTLGEVNRQVSGTAVGGKGQADAMRWLFANIRFAKKLGHNFGPWRFAYLFKGHSHHTLGLRNYSGVDVRSITEAVEIDGLEVAVGPLVGLTLSQPEIKVSDWSKVAIVDQKQRVTVKFYYYSRQMLTEGAFGPTVVIPEIVEDKEAPFAPPLSWEFSATDYFDYQLELVKKHGCEVTVDYVEGESLPLKIRLTVTHPSWKKTVQITTKYNFPSSYPNFRVVSEESGPQENKEVKYSLRCLWQATWYWGENLVEGIKRLEARGELSEAVPSLWSSGS